MPQVRNRHGRFERDAVEQARLDAEAAAMRRDRMSYRQIAAVQGVVVHTAFDRVQRAIAAVPYEAVTELRRIELESLDELEEQCRTVIEDPPILVQQGHVILDPTTGAPMIDQDAILRAAQTLLRIKDMRAKLVGSYAPSKSQVTVITEDVVDAEIQRLEGELARRSASVEARRSADAPTPPG